MGDPGFDVLRYAAEAQGSLRAQLVGVGEDLAPDVRDLLEYLRGRFSGTTSWLRLVLVTHTHKEARVTAFLAAWAYESHWAADALAALLGDTPMEGVNLSAPSRARDRIAPLAEAVIANVHGEALVAAQMAERVVDTAVLDRMLSVAADIASGGVGEDLERLRHVLLRQQLFFRETATARLSRSTRARRLTRTRLAARAWPIGADRDRGGTARAFALLDRADPGWATQLDQEIEQALGLPDLGLLEGSRDRPGRPPEGRLTRVRATLTRAADAAVRARRRRATAQS